jgi:hypothetical protein
LRYRTFALSRQRKKDAWLSTLAETRPLNADLVQELTANRKNLLFIAYDDAQNGLECPPTVQVTRVEVGSVNALMSDQVYQSLTEQLKVTFEPRGVVVTGEERMRWGEILIAHYTTD